MADEGYIFQALDTTGPGPAKYNLQNSKPTKQKIPPAYSISSRLDKRDLSHDSPGPAGYGVPNVTASKHPSYESSPQVSILGRNTFNPDKENRIGPAKYYPNMDGVKRKAPAHHIAGRRKEIGLAHASPGPMKYMVPDSIGRNHPSLHYSGGAKIANSRSSDAKPFTTPGPKYQVIDPQRYKRGAKPAYSIVSRHQPPHHDLRTPGPCKYNIQDMYNGNKATSPRFTMGTRHSKKVGIFKTKDD